MSLPTNFSKPRKSVLKLAIEFCRQMQTQLSDHEMAEAVALNAVESDPRVCHTHDFTDANEVMAEAFAVVNGRMSMSQRAIHEMNSAWARAKLKGFDVSELRAIEAA